MQRKIDELFHRLPNMLATLDDILIAGFNDIGRDHDAAVNNLLRICRQAT